MPQPRWLELAWGDLGVAETPGAATHRRVVRYYADVGHPQVSDDEVAWCAAFVGACLERAGIASTRSLMARSYLDWGEPRRRAAPPAPSPSSAAAPIPRLGHVGFLVGSTATDIILLGGNQGDAVTVQAFPRSRLLGLRWPASSDAPPHLSSRKSRPATLSGTQRHRRPLFERALAHVLEMEGGYDDDPYDPGGPTNLGITLADFAARQGRRASPPTTSPRSRPS